jgi:DNA-binding NtrC family response regulator
LRERTEDIPLVASHYLDEYTRRYHKALTLDPSLLQHLVHYHWPGNIRELQHAVERAVILSKNSVLTVSDFQLVAPRETNNYEKTLKLTDMEREVIREALRKSNGNLTKAAEELGIGRTTLYRKMEEYGLST